MKTKNLLFSGILVFALFLSFKAQVPTAGFSISPTPFCTGSQNVYQITDLSTNAPAAWSYTIRTGGFGPPTQPTIVTVQNPTISFNTQGTYTITLVSSNSTGSSTPVSQTIAVSQSPNANINPQNASTCIGAVPLTINVNSGGPGGGAVTYSWSNGATTSSITVTPSVTTIYTCVISSTNGCSSTRTSTITVGTPTVTITSNPASICPGTTSTLMASGTGPGPFLYLWSTNSTSNSITSSTTGVFTATVTNALGCSGVQNYSLGTSTSLSLTASSTPSILCSGNTATLSITGASNYTWSNGSTAVNPTVNPTGNTTYTVAGQIGTCSGTTAITLSVSLIPTITINSNPASVCAGGSATLTASGANAYTWTPGNVFTSSVVVTPGTTTTFSVRGQNPGCPARTVSATIVVAPMPVINIFANSTVACAGEAIALSAFGGNTYSWSNGATSNVILVYPNVSTVYSVTGTNNSNCSGTASLSVTVNDCTGITENLIHPADFVIYPNPSHGEATVKVSENMKLEVYNMSGQLLQVFEAGVNSEVKIQNLPGGLYFVKSYTASSDSQVRKLLIE